MAHDSLCWLCRAPTKFADMHIDHVVPFSLTGAKLDNALRLLELPADFAIDEFQNWAPSHPSCNRIKWDGVDTPPLMIYAVKRCRANADKARRLTKEFEDDKDAAALITGIEQGLASGLRSTASLRALAELADVPSGVELEYADGWTLVERQGHVEVVSMGHRVGVRPAPGNDDATWLCGNCHSRGPWNGVICLVCGVRSGPDD